MNDGDIILRDADIRPALRSSLLGKHAGEADTVIIEELGVCRGRVRVDVAVVNGIIHGYEIKSDRDTLRRLSTQIDFYGKVLDRATLVVGEHHLSHALDILPAWWGVLRVQQTPRNDRFKTIRRGRKNPNKDPRSLVELLWLDDALALLEAREVARGVRGRPRRIVWDRVCEHFSVDEIAAAVRAQLKARAAPQGPP
ncbi:MAG: sce7726 family protein [Candidatus Schekmanbacteria bacterium]|nr:sce7726 family protein [Candidatus Schekmanbacteria bacterium]